MEDPLGFWGRKLCDEFCLKKASWSAAEGAHGRVVKQQQNPKQNRKTFLPKNGRPQFVGLLGPFSTG